MNEQQEQSDSDKERKSRGGLWFGVVILLIVFGLAGVGFYFLQGLRDTQKDLGGEVKEQMSKQLSDYQAQLTAIQSQLANVSREVASKDDHFTKTLADFSALHQEHLDTNRKDLTASIEKIERQLSKTRGDWLMADAEYLLSVANERLQLIGDVHAALAALEAADQRLQESGDTGIIKVREKISEEITTVKAINLPDIVGTYLAIQSLQQQVDNLTLLHPFAGKHAEPSSEKTMDEKGVLDIIGIKHSDQSIGAVLTEEEAAMSKEDLRAKLEIAKLALMQRQEKLYLSSLDDAKNWLSKHFTNDKAQQVFTEQLEKFMVIKIASEFPDVSLSLKMLRDINKKHIEMDKAQPVGKPDSEKVIPAIEEKTSPISVPAVDTPEEK